MGVPAAPVVAAEPVKVASEGGVTQAGCAGGSAAVSGSRNTVTLGGACAGLSVRGDANTLTVDLAPSAAIDVEGSGNRLTLTVAAGAAPAVRLLGGDTVVAAAAGPTGEAAGPIQLTGDNQSVQLDCGGQAVTIAGNHSRYELRGGCASLVARGDGNRLVVALRPGALAEVEGNGTTLDYVVAGGGAEPTVTMRGRDAVATRGGQPPPATHPPPAPAALVMTQPAVHSHLAQTVHDLDAKIVIGGTLVAVPATALFDGASDAVRGEADPQIARIADLAAQTHPSAIAVTAHDPVDPELASRRAKAVGAAVERAGAAAPVQATGVVAEGAAGLDVLLVR